MYSLVARYCTSFSQQKPSTIHVLTLFLHGLRNFFLWCLLMQLPLQPFGPCVAGSDTWRSNNPQKLGATSWQCIWYYTKSSQNWQSTMAHQKRSAVRDTVICRAKAISQQWSTDLRNIPVQIFLFEKYTHPAHCESYTSSSQSCASIMDNQAVF